MGFRVGDRVVKDPEGWVASESDGWGAGEGVGVVVAIRDWPDPEEGLGCLDVKWPAGAAFQHPSELRPAPDQPENSDSSPDRSE